MVSSRAELLALAKTAVLDHVKHLAIVSRAASAGVKQEGACPPWHTLTCSSSLEGSPAPGGVLSEGPGPGWPPSDGLSSSPAGTVHR